MVRTGLISWGMAAALIAGACSGAGSGERNPRAHEVTPIDTRPITPPEDDELMLPLRPGDGAGSGPKREPFEGTTGVTDRPRPGAKAAVLRDVRTAQNEGFDRVVFEIKGDAPPGFHVGYVDKPPAQCGSGKATSVEGKAFIEVRLSPAQAHDKVGKATVKDRERKTKLPILQELELTCDFEGQVIWVLGLSSRNRYRVLELTGPTRIVVDVQH